MISLITFLFVLGILILVHEFGHFIAAKRVKVRVEKFSLGFGPTILSRKKNDTAYSINVIPLGGYVKLAGDNLEEYKGRPDEYLNKTPNQRAKIIFCGPLLNYLLGFLVFWLIFFAGYPMLTTKVGSLLDGFGAKEAGMQAGDKIISVDGTKIDTWDDLQKNIQDKQIGSKLKIFILRGSKEYMLEVKVKTRQAVDPFGQERSVGAIGITPAGEMIKVRHGFVESFVLSVERTLQLTMMTYKALWRMITGKLSMRESVTGPLGIFYITSKAAQHGIIAILNLVALLSISLSIFNLLPLPVLDGGHLLLLGIEKIRGKALSLKMERVITQIGMTLIVTLAIFVTYNDILNFFGDKISKFFAK